MRIVAKLVVIAASGLLLLGFAVPAGAATGPRTYQLLAAAQTRQTMRNLTTPFAQVSSPASCRQATVSGNVLLLPVLGGLGGNQTLACTTRARAVLVDLGGYVCTEDNDPNDVYTTAGGDVLRFSHGNLAAICQDVIRFVTPAALTVDGRAVRHDHVAVGTREFVSTVQSSTGSYWDSSVALGHPGRLWSAYGGDKQLLALDVGRHTVVTDLTAFLGTAAVLTFVIDVCA